MQRVGDHVYFSLCVRNEFFASFVGVPLSFESVVSLVKSCEVIDTVTGGETLYVRGAETTHSSLILSGTVRVVSGNDRASPISLNSFCEIAHILSVSLWQVLLQPKDPGIRWPRSVYSSTPVADMPLTSMRLSLLPHSDISNYPKCGCEFK